jgi:hypothetical protein
MEAALQEVRSFVADAAWAARRRRFLDRHLGPAATGESGPAFADHLRRILSEKAIASN